MASVFVIPGWGHINFWKVEKVGRAKNGNQLVRYLEGPLKGKEARVASRTVKEWK